MLTDGFIRGRHWQCFQLLEVYPSEVMASNGFERAFLNPTMINQKKDRLFWIGVEGCIKNHSGLHLHLQLFL